MSRWDSLRPSSTETNNDTKTRTFSQTSAASASRPSTNTQRSWRPSEEIDINYQELAVTRRPISIANDKALSYKSIRRRTRSVSTLSNAAAVVQEDSYTQQKLIASIRDKISQQQQNSKEIATASLYDDLKEIRTVKVSNGQCNKEICILLMDLLQMNVKDLGFTADLLIALQEELRHGQRKKCGGSWSKEEAMKAMQVLKGQLSETPLPVPTGILMCLALLVQTHAEKLPTEDTAQNVVHDLFLQYLERQQEANQNHSTSASHPSITTFSTVCQALVSLLQDRRHASSILAPLVEDIVLKDGMERTIENPIRAKLLSVTGRTLQHCHEQTVLEVREILCIVEVVTSAVDSMRKLNQNPTALIVEGKKITAYLQPFFLSVFKQSPTSNEQLRKPSLRLFRSIMACYPSCMTGIGWKLLIEDHGEYIPLFFATLGDGGIDTSLSTLSVEALADIVVELPWKRWLNQDVPQNRRTTSGFFRKVASALESLLSMAQAHYQSAHSFSNATSYVRFHKALLTVIPICEDGIKRGAMKFWGKLADSIFDSTTASSKLTVAAESIMQSCGGYSTPSGELIGMCDTGRRWFTENTDVSGVFVKRIFDSVELQGQDYKSHFNLLLAILRTTPEVAGLNWTSCHCLLQSLCYSQENDRRLLGLKMLQALMLGRKDFCDSVQLGGAMVDFTMAVLESSDQIDIPQSISTTLVIYSSFVGEDWRQVVERGVLPLHFERIMRCCRHLNAKFRELGCKAVGEFCTQFFGTVHTSIDLNSQEIVNVIFNQMLLCTKDANVGVRAMAIFAIGNLNDSIRISDMYQLSSGEMTRRFISVAIKSLDDNNDKVVSNAIRCIGHAGFVLFKQASSSLSEFTQQTIEALTEKLSYAVTVSLSCEARERLTWKQRAAAKKHGWGACHSLGLLLEGMPEDFVGDTSTNDVISCAFQRLVQCVENHEILSLKLVVSAIDALCKFPPGVLFVIGAEYGIIGAALADAIVLLSLSRDDNASNRNPIDGKLAQRNEALLKHLLRCSSISDAKHVMLEEKVSFRDLNHLYVWMVEQTIEDVEASAYEKFALGLSSLTRWSDGIALEQRFASKATQQQKLSDESIRASDAVDVDLDEL